MRDDIVKWVEALRSGDYKQCKGTLHNGTTGGFCCLGVYAVVSGIATPKEIAVYADAEEMEAYHDEGPMGVYEYIRRRVPESIVDSGITMNENGETFSKIADMIEDYYRIMYSPRQTPTKSRTVRD